MAVLRIDIVRALDELASQEDGMRFQGLAVVLGKKRWPELIARQRKKDFGLDAYAPSSLTAERIGKGLAASITPTLKKISGDANTAKEKFPDLKMLLFVTSAKVGNADRKQWEQAIQKDYDLELHIIEREDIITLMMMPENASLLANFLYLNIDAEPQVADLIDKTRRAADAVTLTWARKTKGHPLIDLTAEQLNPDGAESAEFLSLEQIDQALSQSRRIVLEGPAGRGKTTTLIQLAQRVRTAGTALIVELPAWTSSRRGILEYIAGMPAFQAEGLKPADLARVQQTEPFLFLLNGWNEIAESTSEQADAALRELERDFPSAGIIVATRTHHLTPPLPGALRLRLLRLRRVQQAAYLEARLGAEGAVLRARIDADPSLDELTRTPFILSEVASLFEAGAEIPSTKIGVLAQVLRLQEQRDEHRNALQTGPIFGRQTDYLKALSIEMTRRGTAALPETDARAITAAVARELTDSGQIEMVGAPAVLATLTAHHVLERVDYPQTVFQFEHQQLQEYFAAIEVRTLLLELQDKDSESMGRFTADYVNDPAWAEPLRMIAETFAEQTGVYEIDGQNTRAGVMLLEMAISVDPVFSGELAQLCGVAVWNEIRSAVSERLRSVYTIHDGSFRQYAIAAMLATGADDFSDIILPLLSDQNQQTRLSTYRLWPDILVSSLGSDWRNQVSGWSDEARVDFVSELLYHRANDEIVAFAAEDNNIAVKEAAANGLMWIQSDDSLIRLLESMDAQTFEDIARKNADIMPAALRPKTVAATLKFIESTMDHPNRLRAALDLIELGETGLEGIVKDAMAALPSGYISNLGPHYIQKALKYLLKADPAWASEWVATHVAEDGLHGNEHWLPFATAIPDDLVEKYLQRLETEDLKNRHFEGMTAVIATSADGTLAARVFAKLRELRRKVDAEPSVRHELELQIMRQLEAVFRRLPDDIAVTGVLSSITSDDPLDIRVAANLFSRVARSDVEPLRIADDNLKACLRAYLKGSVDLVLRQDDFNGEEKADLASSIAQVGKPEDMAELVTLIRADIERMHRGQVARAAGDRGPLGNGGYMSYASWNISAVTLLNPAGADQVLIDLLPEPEYTNAVLSAMTRDYVMPIARESRTPAPGNEQRRTRFSNALNAEIKRLSAQSQDVSHTYLKEHAMALSVIDGHGSSTVVLDVISEPGLWDHYTCLKAAKQLLMAGVVLPATTAFVLVDSILERTSSWMGVPDRGILISILALCPFVDNPAAGIAKIRDVLRERQIRGSELREIITALGKSRSDAAIDLVYELASDAHTFERCQDVCINAIAALDTPHARDLLMGFIDPDIRGIVPTRSSYKEDDVLVARLAELARRRPEAAMRLRDLCERDLPELNRQILSSVMDQLGTPESLAANLNLIDDANRSPVPQGIRDRLESAFVERRPYGDNSNSFTRHARASNDLRLRLFEMAINDEKRRRTAAMLLGKIEEWRLEYGRPADEPRHPDLASGRSWPP